MGAPFSYWEALVTSESVDEVNDRICIEGLSLIAKGPNRRILDDIHFEIGQTGITAVIGPSGAGKTALMRCIQSLGRMGPDYRVSGRIVFNDRTSIDLSRSGHPARSRIGWIGPAPSLAPGSVYKNIASQVEALNPKIPLLKRDALVEECLQTVGLWPSLADKQHIPANSLPLGAQFRLTLARALALRPDLIVINDPEFPHQNDCATGFEKLVEKVSQRVAVLLATSDLGKAVRLSGQTVFMSGGRVLEFGDTEKVFLKPQHPECEAFLSRAYV